jgi:nicotinamide-nucleotide amidase
VSAPRAALVSIGDELLTGRLADQDAPLVAAALAELGLAVGQVAVLPDDEALLVSTLRRLAQDHALIVTSGGLGPTLDDVTRHAVATAAGVELHESAEAWEQVRAWFVQRGVEPSPTNRRQALLPAGAELLRNQRGTAPGLWLPLPNGTVVACLPGPPGELLGMLRGELVPRLAARFVGAPRLLRRAFALFGLPESHFAERAGDWMDRSVDPLMGVTARDGLLVASLVSSAPDAEQRLEARAVEFRERFAQHLFAEQDEELEFALGRRLLELGCTVTVAESCTGGRIAAALTRVPGISAVLEECFVTYSNGAKQRRLGVPAAWLRDHGAVSAEVAAALAAGAARVTGAALSLGVTGIAGPLGGSPQRPVGTVHFGLQHRGEVWTVERRFPPVERDRVRRYAEQTGLYLLWSALAGRLAQCGAQLVDTAAWPAELRPIGAPAAGPTPAVL